MWNSPIRDFSCYNESTESAANCGMTQRNYANLPWYLKYHESDFENPSPLSGGSRAVPKLANFIPNLDEYHVYREPFLGGGSVALWVTQKYPNIRVWVNDLYEPLTNFWKTLQDDGDKLQRKLMELKSRYLIKDPLRLFLEAKEVINDREKSHLDRNCWFLRC